MPLQLARPRVQYRGDRKLSSEPVTTEVEQRLRRAGQEQVEHERWKAHGDAAQLGRKGEYDVEVIGWQDALLALRDPARLTQSLALWAMAIAARVVGRTTQAAFLANVEVAA